MAITRSTVLLTGALCLAILLGFIGWRASPQDPDGHPLLLLPDVKRVEDYRFRVGDWVDELYLLDGRLTTLLAGSGDLLSQSRTAQQAFEDSLALTQETDRLAAPPALVGLQEAASRTALAYLEAARRVLLWISAPTPAHYDQAVQQILTGRSQLAELESSTWIR